MGCDIHFFVEKLVDGKWQNVECEGTVSCLCVRYSSDRAPTKNCHWCKGTGEEPRGWYDGRNYALFAVLANVRNYDDTPPIAEAKGFPENASGFVAKEFKEWGPDAHHPSYFTLRELQAHDWDRTETVHGVISLGQMRKLLHERELPREYSRAIFGGKIKNLSWKEAIDMLATEKENPEGKSPFDPNLHYHVQAHWEEKLFDRCPYFTKETMPHMAELGDPDEVRCVFWFDN